MSEQAANAKIVTKLLFRLLPVQILLCAVGAVNGIVSSFFATNYVGVDAMSAVGLYGPVNQFLSAISTILVSGSAILCGKYMGQNKQDAMQNVFSLNLALSLLVAFLMIAVFLPVSLFDWSGFFTRDAAVRPLFNRYLLGQMIGVIPMMLGNSFASFLSLENKGRRTLIASLSYIVANVILNFLFVQVLRLEALGLALASSLGMWVFLGIQAQVFLSGKSYFKFQFKDLRWKESFSMFQIGLPGAISYIYQTARGLIVNNLLEIYVGSVAISAFATANNFLGLIWAIPGGMLAVSRLIISVSMGEEDRQTLTDVMRSMFTRYIPLMCAVVLAIIVCAVPLTTLFYQDAAQPVYIMTVSGFRILPLCMPLSIICMHFNCYAQASGKQGFIHLQSLLDGVICVAGFTALLIPFLGMNSVYSNMEELMVIPDSFGVPPEDRLDFSVRSMEDVVSVAQRIQSFCRSKGITERSAYLAGLSMEEMAGNVVSHGFTKDKRNHSVDVRVVKKDEDLILRIKDDCIPFDPGERQKMAEPSDDIMKNIGIRMIFQTAKDVKYQNILGLNVLTVRIGV